MDFVVEKFTIFDGFIDNFGLRPSIRDWELRKRGLDGDNSCLKFLLNFRKRKLYIF